MTATQTSPDGDKEVPDRQENELSTVAGAEVFVEPHQTELSVESHGESGDIALSIHGNRALNARIFIEADRAEELSQQIINAVGGGSDA